MNKENRNPNQSILKRNDAQLSSSRSIPSIFRRRRKRARPTQTHNPLEDHSQHTNLQHIKSLSTIPHMQNPSSVACLTEYRRSHQQSKFDRIKTELLPTLQTAGTIVTNPYQQCHNGNHQAHLNHMASTTGCEGREREIHSDDHKNFAKCLEAVNVSSQPTVTTQQNATINNHKVVCNSQALEEPSAEVEKDQCANSDGKSTNSLHGL